MAILESPLSRSSAPTPALSQGQACDDTHSCGNQPAYGSLSDCRRTLSGSQVCGKHTNTLDRCRGDQGCASPLTKEMEGTPSLAHASGTLIFRASSPERAKNARWGPGLACADLRCARLPLHSEGGNPPLALAAPAGVGQGQGVFVSKHGTAIQEQRTWDTHTFGTDHRASLLRLSQPSPTDAQLPRNRCSARRFQPRRLPPPCAQRCTRSGTNRASYVG